MSRVSRATAMQSRTVSDGNSRTLWNDRIRPRTARLCGASFVTSSTEQRTVPSRDGQRAGQAVEQAGLAGAVRAEDADHLAGVHVERHASTTRTGPYAAEALDAEHASRSACCCLMARAISEPPPLTLAAPPPAPNAIDGEQLRVVAQGRAGPW